MRDGLWWSHWSFREGVGYPRKGVGSPALYACLLHVLENEEVATRSSLRITTYPTNADATCPPFTALAYIPPPRLCFTTTAPAIAPPSPTPLLHLAGSSTGNVPPNRRAILLKGGQDQARYRFPQEPLLPRRPIDRGAGAVYPGKVCLDFLRDVPFPGRSRSAC